MCSGIISIQVHNVRIENERVNGFSWVLSRMLKALPDGKKVVVDISEDVGLPARISAKALKLEWAMGE